MTPGDEHLAPVTSLFGRRGAAGRSGPTGDSADGDGAGAQGAGEWAAADKRASDEWAPADRPGADEAPAGEPAGRRAGADEFRGDESRADDSGASSEPPVMGVVSALPTYAAFAAKSERASRTAVSFSEAVNDDRDHDDGEHADGADTEPEETLEAARHRAENISLHALSRRGVSSSEMAKTLRSRDLPEEVVAAEIERLERVGLLDDAELAENLVRSKQERKGLGKSAITSELRQRGLAQEVIDAAIAEIDDDEEQARADEWALKRAGQLRGLDQATAERRLNGFLMRRGYRSEVIRRAVERALPRGGSGRGGVRFE